MSNSFDHYIEAQRQRLSTYLSDALTHLAKTAWQYWQTPTLDAVLQQILRSEKHLVECQCLYIVDPAGKQLSANIDAKHIDNHARGQNLANRPYLIGLTAPPGLSLSPVYINRLDGYSCISAIQSIYDSQNKLQAYVIADFSLLSLPVNSVRPEDRQMWLQAKGDPSIRGTLFQQTRTQSPLDDYIDDVIDIVIELLLKRGIFHAKLHFSSSRITLWLYQDPYRYRVHLIDEIKQACLAYPPCAYPTEATVTAAQIKMVFQHFKTLRFIDETLYLRSASLNIINGMVALNFSCDGTHYLPTEKFLVNPEIYTG